MVRKEDVAAWRSNKENFAKRWSRNPELARVGGVNSARVRLRHRLRPEAVEAVCAGGR